MFVRKSIKNRTKELPMVKYGETVIYVYRLMEISYFFISFIKLIIRLNNSLL